jgi:hypothetical protein
VADSLHNAFRVGYADLDHEVKMPNDHDRADILFEATVLEFKADLRREAPAARKVGAWNLI